MKVKIEIEDGDKKIIYPGDNQELNFMLYRLINLIYSNTEFTLHHKINNEILDLETFKERKIISKVDHEFSFDINVY